MPVLSTLKKKAYRKYKTLEENEHSLRYLFLEITRRCNLNCRHCGSDCTHQTHVPELTTDSWLKIITYLKRNITPLPVIVLTGGEPLIHPGLMPITKALGEGGFPWGMVTNGIALTEEKLASLRKNGLKSLTLSYDGDRDSINFIRNSPNAFASIDRALSVIGASDIPVKDAVTCVFPGNIDKLNLTAKRLMEAGMNSMRLFRIFPKGRAENNNELLLDHQQSHQMLQWITENRPVYKKKGLDISFSCEGYLPWETDRKVRSEPFFCRAGINIASILCDGNVTGCSNNGPEFYQGSVLKRDFLDIWNREFGEYRDKNWMRTGICSDCGEWDDCRGGSIHLRSKSKDGPDFCYFSQCPGSRRLPGF